jgi:ABC-type sugar transport system substrate-binding protein
MAAVRSEAAKCANVKQVPRIGQGDLQRSIGDVNGMVSQGVDAIAIIPDWGKSQLPSLRAATDAGVKTVPWAADPGGKDGEDYVQYLDWDEHGAGLVWGEWVSRRSDVGRGCVLRALHSGAAHLGVGKNAVKAFAGVAGDVYAGLMPTMTRAALAPSIRRVVAEHPNVTVHVVEGHQRRA